MEHMTQNIIENQDSFEFIDQIDYSFDELLLSEDPWSKEFVDYTEIEFV